MTDTEQLTALFDRMCQAWSDGDAVAYGACFTAGCDYVSFDGSRAQGRGSMVDVHDKLFRGVLFGSALVGEVESIRHLGPDEALLYGTGSVLTAWRSKPPRKRLTRNTVVAARTGDGWRFTASHNGLISPLRIRPDSFPARANRILVRAFGALGIGRSRGVPRPSAGTMP